MTALQTLLDDLAALPRRLDEDRALLIRIGDILAATGAGVALGTAAYVDTGISAGNVPTVDQADARYQAAGVGGADRYMLPVTWGADAIAINLTHSLLANRAGGPASFRLTRAGSIVGMAAVLSAGITVGDLNLFANVNGAAVWLLALGESGVSASHISGAGVYPVAAGDIITLDFTTDATLTPAASVNLSAWIEFEAA